jgi:DNA-directed RNA polymerase sigma subunit (sigma70/sigma32)
MIDTQETVSTAEFENRPESFWKNVDDPALFSQTEESMLIRRVQQGETKALSQLLKMNIGLVIGLAREYKDEGVPLMDLIATGNLALIKAARYYREIEGLRFMTYAVILARQLMLEMIVRHK